LNYTRFEYKLVVILCYLTIRSTNVA